MNEPVAVRKGAAAFGGAASDRLTRLKRTEWASYTFAFHDSDEIGPGLLAQIAKKTGLTPEDL